MYGMRHVRQACHSFLHDNIFDFALRVIGKKCKTIQMNNLDPRAFLYVAASGEQVRGSPGCVIVKTSTSEAKYVLLNEVEPLEIQNRVRDLIEEEEEEHYYILFEEEQNVHIVKVSKRDAASEMLGINSITDFTK